MFSQFFFSEPDVSLPIVPVVVIVTVAGWDVGMFVVVFEVAVKTHELFVVSFEVIDDRGTLNNDS